MESLLPCEIHCFIVKFLDSASIHFLSQVSRYWGTVCRFQLKSDIDKMRTKLITTKLIEKNYIPLFKYAIEKKYKLGFRSYNASAKIGNLEILKFLRSKKVPMKPESLLIAVAYNNMDIIEWITSEFHDLHKEINWRRHKLTDKAPSFK